MINSEDNHIPIHEIDIPAQDDIQSELSTLLTYANNYQDYDHQVTQGSSHRQQTHPTGVTGDSQETSFTRRAFHLASVLALLSMCALLYADVVVNANQSQNSMIDQWDIESDAPTIRGEMFDATNADELTEDHKSFWHKLRNVDSKSAKKRQKKTAKTDKKPKTSKENNDTNDGGRTDKNNLDADKALMDDDNDTIIYPNTNLNYEPKLIPSEVIAAATEMDDPKHKMYKPMDIPEAHKRCEYVIQTFEDQNVGVSHDFLKEKYIAQSVDPNVFYRATALLFWKDFGGKHWGEDQNKSIELEDLVLLDEATYEDGTPLSPMSTWTWITGDQHLSNFGAWRNRGGEVVFSVNDFDEAAIYDFHIDVLRIAVSICNHGFTNGLTVEQIGEALEAFTFKYVKTAIGYVGGDAALLYELTADTSTGMLRDFLSDIEKKKSRDKQLDKFTEIGNDGVRRFSFNNDSRLEGVPIELGNKIRAQIVSTKYGASLMKMGWRVRGWDDDFFKGKSSQFISLFTQRDGML